MKYTTTCVVRSLDVDINHALKPSALDQLLQDSAEKQIAEVDKEYDRLYEEDGKAFILSRIGIEIYGTVDKYAQLTSSTWVTQGKAANFPRAYELEYKGELLARAFSNWALLDVDTKKIMRYKEYDMSAYHKDEEPEMSIPARFRIPNDVEFPYVTNYKVGYSYIDINGHMNNTMYLDLLVNTIPNIEEYRLTSINLRYVHEAPYGATVNIYTSAMLEPGDMDPRADKLVYIKTETGNVANVHAAFGFKKI